MSRSQQINDSAAEAMRRADDAAAESPTEESHPESGATQQQQQNEAAAEAMRRADVAYTMDDDM
ncbi:hypothetical protein LMJF_24_1600 [Leishmania major strain Friedlin]|uniref:Uncharacterized protein n=1 Tax=Leishmania major TaxID=5664 RepID=Q4QAH1_LEIMA|nr:hypothetical protein LMJF_24_1600 [Leishmania major strain Friedlin]CAG9574633.1 hypothetical_protein_-_conserved [Leishmania major strain Friedlin]CAJ05147.1 hypothetical protein LMJF_24_1600 [Leishmania major strain Friedlin]|eukprot:XP_001683677.1 hypothetical protein LMJF_24_1600 [Leishmania major strain Friedlin]